MLIKYVTQGLDPGECFITGRDVRAKSLQLSLGDPVDLQPTSSVSPWDSPGKNTRVGCHALLQGTFLTQGSNPMSLMSPALAGRFFTTCTTWEAQVPSGF